MARHIEPEPLWAAASLAIAAATRCDAEDVRIFLDSKSGRHFSDDVMNGLSQGKGPETAIAAAIERWMSWRIGRATSRETGIPEGLPYLVGYVAFSGICEEVE
ncbi:hypothetical protein [Methylosinus sp. KRF6]|uniref:hypothetical protein n=1 Tax=Methylosinus sp. KRF6 TaxID=2846853 RepID=UPI001C0D4B66|nr:hypothetical protein [Methylosinus sp. KRF6]MBU3890102.1 hypothetical protein [Methylosinus sp. KRF6]